MPKIIAIHSGSDWYDACADYLILPEGMDFAAEQEAWRHWYETEYKPVFNTPEMIPYIDFISWLKDKGAVAPPADQLEVVEIW